MHDEQAVLDALQQYQKLSNKIRGIAIKMATVRQLMFRDAPETCYTGFEIDTFNGREIIIANFSEHYCGETDYSNLEIPLHYFWTEDEKLKSNNSNNKKMKSEIESSTKY